MQYKETQRAMKFKFGTIIRTASPPPPRINNTKKSPGDKKLDLLVKKLRKKSQISIYIPRLTTLFVTLTLLLLIFKFLSNYPPNLECVLPYSTNVIDHIRRMLKQ